MLVGTAVEGTGLGEGTGGTGVGTTEGGVGTGVSVGVGVVTAVGVKMVDVRMVGGVMGLDVPHISQ
jgi:hypothetical protein